MHTRSAFLSLGVVLFGSLVACSPHPPTDGFYACEATSACPALFPYCDPVEHRCYANVPDDAGPRPDSPPPDAFGSAFRGEYEACTATTDCAAPLMCIGNACMTGCSTSGCTGGRVCRAVSMSNAAAACVASCTGGAACPATTHSRPGMMGDCHCAPASWP